MQVLFDSDLTSGFAISNFPKEFLASAEEVGKEETQFKQSLAQRCFDLQDLTLASAVGEQGEVTRSESFESALFLSTMSGVLVSLTGFKETWDCVVFQGDSIDIFEVKGKATPVEGPSRESWIVPTWTLVQPQIPAEVEEPLSELRAFSERLFTLSPPQRSPELIGLARKAVQELSHRKDEDIDAWARRLARDVADADD